MAQGNAEPIQWIGIFGIRHDKNRGLLVETLETTDGKEYFFKYHDQTIDKHCQQVQNIVKAANIQRARKLQIDLTKFVHEYCRASDNAIIFRGIKLTSVQDQVEKAYTMRLNREMGIAKRQQTLAKNKQNKIDSNNKEILTRIEAAEKQYQDERARRIYELFGEAQGSGSGSQANGAHNVPLPQDSDESM